MEIDIKGQEAKLMSEAQEIGEQLGTVRDQIVKFQQVEQQLLQRAMKNQGGFDLLKSMNGKEPEEK